MLFWFFKAFKCCMLWFVPLLYVLNKVQNENIVVSAKRFWRNNWNNCCYWSFFRGGGHLGDLLLWVGVCRRPSSSVRRPLSVNIFFSRNTEVILTKFAYNIIYMIPRAGVLVIGCDHISHIVNNALFLLLYSGTWFRQTLYIVIMTKEGYIRIINFMNPGAGVLMLGCGHISHIGGMHYFF